MADISMCINKECPKKFKCYRFMAYNSPYQSVGEFKPNEQGECSMFWALKNQAIRVTEDWNTGKIQDLTPDENWAKSLGIYGEEAILRLNYQKVKVWIIKRRLELEKSTIQKIKKNFYLTKACMWENGRLILKYNNSPLVAEFYVITDKILIINRSQKVMVRIEEKEGI